MEEITIKHVEKLGDIRDEIIKELRKDEEFLLFGGAIGTPESYVK